MKVAKHGMVVYGQDKPDEISMSAPTTVCEFKDGWFKTYNVTPEDFGFERCTKASGSGYPRRKCQDHACHFEWGEGP